MAKSYPKHSNAIDTQLYDMSDEDRQEIIDYALHPANGLTAICVFLHVRGIVASQSTVNKWHRMIRAESIRVGELRAVFNDYIGITPDEICAYVATVMAQTMVNLQKEIESNGLDARKIQSLTSLAKEARASALAMNSPSSSASMKELELSMAFNFTTQLEAIFEEDPELRERIVNACRSITVGIEAKY
jgi:hypothetical protein